MPINLNRRQALLGATAISLTAAGCGTSRPAPPRPSGAFRHGVASGEPDQSSVVLWTAITEDGGGERGVEVARDDAFTDIVFEQSETITYIRINPVTTLKIIADGLDAGTAYFYRFRFGDEYSPIGVTRTLPEGALDQFNIAVCSCSNYPAGYFNAYAELAATDNLDLVLHLGDYIYEYGVGGYADDDAEKMDRTVIPAHECLIYEDYAARHALYKTDPDLQAAHAAAPWFIAWDDHEVANDAWSGGAENHTEGDEGVWQTRVSEALRAFHDWNPTRTPDDFIGGVRTIEIGDLATIALTESRHIARTEPLTFDTFPIPADSDDTDPANQEAVATWLRDVVGDPSRELLGEAQIEEIGRAFSASRSAGKSWRFLAGQVLMGKVNMPNYMEVLPGWLKWYIRNNNELAWSFVLRSRFNSPFNFDSWDGYSAERERLFQTVRETSGDMIALAGDSHNFWTCALADDDGQSIGVEFGTTSVSSPSPFEYVVAPGVDFGEITVENNAEIIHHNAYAKGFIRLVLTPDSVESEFVEVSTIKKRGYSPQTESRWRVTRGTDGLAVDAV